MPLSPGTRLGPYEITGPLGAGGMGEVYRAKDTRLGRDVAVKVLAQHLSLYPEVRARFEREAKTISSLNHPRICTLFDVGCEGDVDYLVMELVDGETLAERLEKGQLPVPLVLEIGAQIADALDRAHRAGVIHRDLKPGNVMLTKSGAKLMDFGLARSAGAAVSGAVDEATVSTPAQSRTVDKPLTAEGTIVGTFQYMAPEQLEGQEADARSDLWALGCVLYEMATGRRAFAGKSKASLIGSIMHSEVAPISAVAPLSPPGLERLVQACLAKDPTDRLQSAHDIKMQLAWLAEGGSQAGVPAPVAARRRSRAKVATTLAAAGWLVAVVLAWQAVTAPSPEPEAIQALLGVPPDARLGARHADVALSPDGRTVAFSTFGGLWLRPLGAGTARRVAETDGAFRPFWSPDSRTIAFFQDGRLMRVPLAGGSPTRVCEASSGRGGTWGPDDTIVFAPGLGGPLQRVPAAGGDPVAVTTLESTGGATGHRFPCFLPDGEHFLFAALPGGPNGWDTYVGSLRSPAVVRLLTAGSVATYAEPGYLLFVRDGHVLAQRFDAQRLALEGAPTSIADAPKRSDLDAEPVASASQNRRLTILFHEPADTRLEIQEADGAPVSKLDLPPAPWRVLSASPDGRRAAVSKGDELWVVDLSRSVPMRLASRLASDPSTVWSPDGSRIAFVARGDEREEVYLVGMDGRSELVPTTDDPFKIVSDWSRDGRYLVFGSQSAETDLDLWVLPMDGDRKPVPYLRSPAVEARGKISPDGRWLAYESNETGTGEIYVQSFPEAGRKVRVSIDGGFRPGWESDGRGLRYLDFGRREILVVPVPEGDAFEPGLPRTLRGLIPGATSGADIGSDGRRLFAVTIEQRPRDIRVLLEWTALLGR